RWITARYFGAFNSSRRDRWVFGDRDSGAYLAKFAWTKITRHTLVKGWASPDDPALTDYWAARRRRGRPPLDRVRLRLLQRRRRRSNAPPLPDWKPPYYILEAAGFEVWLVNARDVKHLPGRPKSDTIDSVWLCKVGERQMIRASFVPPVEVRALRDLTRYRVDLVAACTADKQRTEKFLKDACIKVSSVVSDLFGVSGRDM